MKEIEENWNQMTQAYEAFTENGDSYSEQIEWPCIEAMLSNLAKEEVLDLGCAAGRFSFLLEEKGAKSVLGVDLSERMLELAQVKAKKRHSTVQFQKGDIENLREIEPEGYSLVFCSTTLHYVVDLKKAFQNISRVMKKDGRCIVSVMHPVYTAQYPIAQGNRFPEDEDWVVRYLDSSKRSYVQPWIEYNDEVPNFLSTSYHYTFSEYFHAIQAAGLRITKMEEPRPPKEWKDKFPGRYAAFIETPCYLILELRKEL